MCRGEETGQEEAEGLWIVSSLLSYRLHAVQTKRVDSGSSGSEIHSGSESDIEGHSAHGRDVKRRWALSHFKPRKRKNKNGALIWEWTCIWCQCVLMQIYLRQTDTDNHCRTCKRNTPRSPDCDTFAEESNKLKLPAGSNFIKHAVVCSKRPPEHEFFPGWTAESLLHPEKSVSSRSTSTIADGLPLTQQQQLMRGFVTRGHANPMKTYSPHMFRDHQRVPL